MERALSHDRTEETIEAKGRWLTGNLIYASGGFLMFMNEG